MISNREIASHLYELATLSALAEGSTNAFRVRAYQNAARAVQEHPEPVAEMPESALTTLRGVGASTARKIRELSDTGTIERLETLRAEFPREFVELTRVPGVGPKTAVRLRDELGVRSIDDLRAALERAEVRTLPGMGAKTEEKLLRALARLGGAGKERRTPIIEAMRVADDVVEALTSIPGVVAAEPMGSLRRFRETVGDVDILVASVDAGTVMDRVRGMPVAREVIGSGETKTSVLTPAGLQIDVRVVRPEQWGSAQMYFTGSKAHNIRLRQRAIDRGLILNEYGVFDAAGGMIAADSEERIYAVLGLAWIAPELREDVGEIEAAQADGLPDLVAEGDVRGDLHVHTSLSGDGRDGLEQMVEVAKRRGYAYLAITDHAENLKINGASRAEMLDQRDRIAAIRRHNRKLRVLQGVELNIARDGSVDYDAEFLALFDWGVASVHSHFDLPVAEQTARVVAAMHNPAVNVIGHLTGRRIGRRPGIELDVDVILGAAEESGCGIEINCHLDRLDAPAEILHRALGRDVKFVISTDAHDASELSNIRWGVKLACRGWVGRHQIVNTWDRESFLEWAKRKRR